MASIIGATHLIKYKKQKAKPEPTGGYKRRKRLLSDLGYSTYQEYLAGDDWKRIRNRKLLRFPDCLICSRKSSQVHHMDYEYETLLGLRTYSLITICDACHLLIEFDGDGKKRDLKEANKELRKLASTVAGKSGKRWLARVKGSAVREKRRKEKQALKTARSAKTATPPSRPKEERKEKSKWKGVWVSGGNTADRKKR